MKKTMKRWRTFYCLVIFTLIMSVLFTANSSAALVKTTKLQTFTTGAAEFGWYKGVCL